MKLSQLYEKNSFKGFMDAANHSLMQGARKFGDAAASGILLRRNLEAIDPNIFKVMYPENVFMNSGIELNNFGGHSEEITSLRTRGQGSFRNSSDRNGDKGRIQLTGEKSTIGVAQREVEVNWTQTEVEQGQMENRNIISEYATELDRVYKQELDEFAALGVEDEQNGLLNHSAITPVGIGDITAGTAVEAYQAIADAINEQRTAVNNVPEYVATECVFSVPTMAYLSKTILNSAASPATIMAALRQNFPDITFRVSFRCNDVGGNIVMSLYSTNTQVMKFRLPVQMKMSELTSNGFKYAYDAYYRVAGIDLLEPVGLYIATLGSA